MAQKLIRKVYKYGTGQEVPDGAVYLNTVTQDRVLVQNADDQDVWDDCFFVWHYFMVHEYVEYDPEAEKVEEKESVKTDNVTRVNEAGEEETIGKVGVIDKVIETPAQEVIK